MKRAAVAFSLVAGLLLVAAPAWAEGYGVPSPPPTVGGVSFQAPPPPVVVPPPVVTPVSPPEVAPVVAVPPVVLGETVAAPPAAPAPSVGGLAFTGADIAELVGIGLVAIGVGSLLTARRRRSAVLL